MSGQFYERAQPGWEMIERGFYYDLDQNIHFFPGEYLVYNGFADTPANREMIEAAMEKKLREAYGCIPVEYRYPKRG